MADEATDKPGKEQQVESRPAAGPFAFLGRRRFLKLGLIGGGAAAGALGGSYAWLRGGAPAVAGLKVLSATDHRVLSAIGDTILPGGGSFEPGAVSLALPQAFDLYLADEPEQNISDLRSALTLLDFGPLLYERRFTTFSRLSAAERTTHFASWMHSDDLLRRKVALAFRKFFYLVFYDQPDVWPHIGYPGPSMRLLQQDPHDHAPGGQRP